MSGGAVSNNTASYYYSYGCGVYVGGTFTMSGGAVRGNLLSDTNTYGREVLLYNGTFKMSGDARPERVFLYDNSRFITISGLLSGGTVPIDLRVTNGNPLANWINKPVLQLDSSYSGDLASLKTHFTLGNATLTESPYTETPITGYKIADDGKFVTE